MASPVVKCTGSMWLWLSLGMGYRDAQVVHSLSATMEKDPPPGTFPPSALVEGGTERDGRRKTDAPAPSGCYMKTLIPSGLPLTPSFASHPLLLPSRPWE